MAQSKRDDTSSMNPKQMARALAASSLLERIAVEDGSRGPNWVEISTKTLRVDDLIVVTMNKRNNRATTTIKVTGVVYPARGCRNVHVTTVDGGRNVMCYDQCTTVKVRT